MPIKTRRMLKFFIGTMLLLSAQVPAAAVRGGALGVPLPLFPAGNWWNQDISQAPVDPSSSSYISFIGPTRRMHPDFGGYEDPGPPPSQTIYGFPYVVVNGNSQAKKAVVFDYADESDGVNHNTGQSIPFYPIPDEAITEPYWIESGQPGNVDPGGDRHMLIVDKDNNWLYELYALHWDGTRWVGGSGAFFDMNTNNRRPEGWTSADAAGLAILPGLVRYDEVYGSDPIRHALRFTVRATNGHVYPASHSAGSTSGALPMGARLRLKASVDIGSITTDAYVQKIFQAMKTYGLIVADNGSDMYVSGTFDPLWNNDILNPAFSAVTANDFEVIQLGWKPAAVNLSLNLVAGWNWISFNVLPADHSLNSIFAGILPQVEQVKSQTQSAVYANGQWAGDLADLNGISQGQMYKIKVKQACVLTVIGPSLNAGQAISLGAGWNWVAFLPQAPQSLGSALGSIISQVQQVKSQTQSAIYTNGQWVGDLTQMEPGKGYTLMMSAPGTLAYPAN